MSGGGSRAAPIFATAATAARMLDMKPKAFSDLVASGYLPSPHRIGSMERFDMDELVRVIRGEKASGKWEPMEW